MPTTYPMRCKGQGGVQTLHSELLLSRPRETPIQTHSYLCTEKTRHGLTLTQRSSVVPTPWHCDALARSRELLNNLSLPLLLASASIITTLSEHTVPAYYPSPQHTQALHPNITLDTFTFTFLSESYPVLMPLLRNNCMTLGQLPSLHLSFTVVKWGYCAVINHICKARRAMPGTQRVLCKFWSFSHPLDVPGHLHGF